jgi:ubiquinone/menaquinone biosynthesis C-methylase UbiE
LNPSPFDAMAASYDASFTRTAVGTALRAMVQDRLAANFQSAHRILELGCGTGEDALWLARKGVEVVATDASAEMIEAARRKLLQENERGRVVFHRLAMENLGMLTDAPAFDGVFSNFGAINCVADLPAVIAEVARRLAPGARLVWVIMGRHVPWEWLWYLVRGEPAKAIRRYSRQGAVWRGIRIAYPTPRQMAALLMPYFDVMRISPLGWALPPSYASGWVERSPRMFAALTRLETMAHQWRVLAGLADHYILEAQVRPAA